MPLPNPKSLLIALVLPLFGCALSPQNVIETPTVERPPTPSLVKLVPDRPVGYWRLRLNNSLQGIPTP